MTVAELIEILKTMPQDYPVEINDNMNGQMIYIDSVDCFRPEDIDPEFTDEDYPSVVIQANVYEDHVVEDCDDEWPEE
jgi:hypothetical protein